MFNRHGVMGMVCRGRFTMSLCTVSACCGGGAVVGLLAVVVVVALHGQWLSAAVESAAAGCTGDCCSLARESYCVFAVARGSGIQYCL